METTRHSGMGSMRRFIALVSLLLLSLSRTDAMTQARARATASVAHPTREMVAAPPGARFVVIALRELSTRGPSRLLAPWHPSRAATGIALPGALSRADS